MVRQASRFDLTCDYGVVPSGISVYNATFDISKRAFQYRCSRAAASVTDAVKAIFTL